MANRIEGNVYIIDSALNNVFLPWNQAQVASIEAWFSGAGDIRFSGNDTTNVICRFTATASDNISRYFGGVVIKELKVPVLTGGTAWIYFV